MAIAMAMAGHGPYIYVPEMFVKREFLYAGFPPGIGVQLITAVIYRQTFFWNGLFRRTAE